MEETTAVKTLCHQDYAAGNLTIGNDGNLYVYDMDSLTVDLPVRDMRKILNKVYLFGKGALVAGTIPTKDNQLYFIHEGYALVLYTWIEGNDLEMDKVPVIFTRV